MTALLIAGAAVWLLLGNVPPAQAEAQSAEPLPAEAPATQPETSAADPLSAQLARIDSRLGDDDLPAALSLALAANSEFPGRPEPIQRMEMIAALARSNAYAMTPSRFQALRPLLEKAAARDVVSAQVLLGEQLRSREPSEALRWFRAAAENGQTEAMTQTGLMLSNGLGVTKPDLRAAVEWFERATAAGDTDAMVALAECLIHGKGTEKNPKRAVALLQPAVAFNHPLAFNLLGDLYARGLGVPRDDAEAFRLFERGAALGSGDAMANVGVFYLHGRSVPKDPARALKIWREGSERGFAACMVNLAKAELAGTGTPRDPESARSWFISAARAGNAEAIAWCRENNTSF
ncbi:MAG: tetratricopeptide repeat protein [Terrimicrobiaceae bacterium]|nr:tetratricopeptide repeat protein [Terrimicrobiaceae bacterium]